MMLKYVFLQYISAYLQLLNGSNSGR